MARRCSAMIRQAKSGSTTTEAALAAGGYGDITVAQAQVDRDGTRLTTLAERAQVTKQTAGFLVDQVERAGYVERLPDSAGRRARLVLLTARGRAAAEFGNAVAAEVEREWTEHLGAAEMRRLRAALTRLRGLIEPGAAGD